MGKHKWRAPASFDWQSLPENDSNDIGSNAPIRIKHTHLHLDESGCSSSRTSYINAPASPKKKNNQSDHDKDDFWTIDLLNDDSELDPAYIHHLDVNEPGPPHRKKTAAVCI